MKMEKLDCAALFHSQKKKQPTIPKPGDVTDGGLDIWIKLPEQVKHDPILAAYRNEYERSRGERTSSTFPSLTRTHSVKLTSGSALDRIEIVPEENNNQRVEKKPEIKCKKWLNYCKIAILLGVWSFLTVFLMTTDEKELINLPMSAPANKTRIYRIGSNLKSDMFELQMAGPFSSNSHQNTSDFLTVFVQIRSENSVDWKDFDQWVIPIVSRESTNLSPLVILKNTFDLHNVNFNETRIAMGTNFDADFAFQFTFDGSPVQKDIGIIYATVILIGLYVLIIWEIVDKVLATIIASTLSISVLAAMGTRPTLAIVVSWIDIETLFLLFGMMIIVGILSETGLFDYLAVYAYKITKGKAWSLIYCLCLFTAILSALLDNVTTLLLMAPVSIRLCEIMNLNPVPILISMILYSNIGGALTPVGDPPNIIIISNSYVAKNGITFTNFILHMTLGVVFACFQTFVQLRFKYRTINDLRASESRDILQLREEIEVWQKALDSISLYSNSDDFIRWTLVDKVKNLKKLLSKKLKSGAIPRESFTATLDELLIKYPIKNRPLLIKSLLAAAFALGFFFLHSIPGLDRLSLGWIAFLGSLMLLILADKNDMEAALSKVEWPTLIFFASLFVLIEALSEMGLIDWIGDQTKEVIVSVDENWRLTVAILIILWISAVASAFLDNIPLTTMMIKIVVSLAQNQSLGLPFAPLVWALSFGACFGGNGTLIGASANIICIGVAEQYGHKISFYQYFKIGFPIMIGNVLTASAYMIIAHVLLNWY